MAKRINPWHKFYFLPVPNWLARRSEISSSAKLVYGALMEFANKRASCWPSIADIAERISLRKRRTQQVLEELAQNHLIEIRQPSGQRRVLHFNNQYFFLEHPWMEEGVYDVDDSERPIPPQPTQDEICESEEECTPEAQDSAGGRRRRKVRLLEAQESAPPSKEKDSKDTAQRSLPRRDGGSLGLVTNQSSIAPAPTSSAPFVTEWCKMWRARHNQNYLVQGRDRKALKELHSSLKGDLGELRRLCIVYFKNDQPFYSGHPAHKLNDNLNEFRAEAATTISAGGEPTKEGETAKLAAAMRDRRNPVVSHHTYERKISPDEDWTMLELVRQDGTTLHIHVCRRLRKVVGHEPIVPSYNQLGMRVGHHGGAIVDEKVTHYCRPHDFGIDW